jgi:hypothetical protein
MTHNTVVQLKAYAKELGMTGYSKLCKAELIDAIASQLEANRESKRGAAKVETVIAPQLEVAVCSEVVGDEIVAERDAAVSCDVVILTLIAILRFMYINVLRPILAALVSLAVRQWKRKYTTGAITSAIWGRNTRR